MCKSNTASTDDFDILYKNAISFCDLVSINLIISDSISDVIFTDIGRKIFILYIKNLSSYVCKNYSNKSNFFALL